MRFPGVAAVLKPLRAAAAAVCRALLAVMLWVASCSWLPSREALFMLCLLDGAMRQSGIFGSSALLQPGLCWASLAALAVWFRREIQHNCFTLQSLAGEPAYQGMQPVYSHFWDAGGTCS